MAREDDVRSIFTQRITLASGATLMVTPIPGQVSLILKLISGGTLEISGSDGFTTNGAGITYAINGITGGQGSGSFYPIATSEDISMASSGIFYLVASGATCVVALMRGRSINDDASKTYSN